MSQTIDKINSCYPLFEQDEYQELFRNKRQLEEAHDAQRVQEVFAWTTTSTDCCPDSTPVRHRHYASRSSAGCAGVKRNRTSSTATGRPRTSAVRAGSPVRPRVHCCCGTASSSCSTTGSTMPTRPASLITLTENHHLFHMKQDRSHAT